MTEVIALVAARDERERIAPTVSSLRRIPHVTRVVVVDDGSSDDTAARAVDAGATVLRSPRARGKGSALEGAVERLPRPGAWVLADADLGTSARALAPLVETVLSGGADIAVAIVPRGVGGGFGLVKRAAGAAILWLGDLRVAEPLSGQRALTAAAMDAIRPLAVGFGVETAMTIDAARAGLRIVEIPVDVTHRPTHRDLAGFRHRGRQGFHILRAVAARIGGRA